MNDHPAESNSNPTNAPSGLAQDFFANPSKLLSVLADPARWVVLRELAGGQSLTVRELAAKAGRTPNQMGKHLTVLRKAGVVELMASPDGDGRKQVHRVPEIFRRVDEAGRVTLDLGVCVLRFDDGVVLAPYGKD
jgi:DNA-binding transcriptional ArsR family regulator